MANIDNPNGFTFEYSMAGAGSERLVTGIQLINVTITKGDAIIEAGTAGQVDLALSNSPILMGVAAETVVTEAATKLIKFYPALPWYVFSGQCEGTYAETMRYQACDIEGGTGVMEINENATTESVIYIIGEVDGSEIGANTRALFVIHRSAYIPLLAGV